MGRKCHPFLPPHAPILIRLRNRNLAFACVYGKLYMNSVLSILNSRLYEDPDNSEVRVVPSECISALDRPAQTPSSVSGLQLTSIALGATWATKASKQ